MNYSTTKISNLTKIIKPIKIYTALIDYFEKNSLTNAITNFEYFKEKWLRYYKDTGNLENLIPETLQLLENYIQFLMMEK